MKTSFLAVFILYSVSLQASNYYLSSESGDDYFTSDQAQHASTPWKTISKLNSFTDLQPGDSILFKRGESFYGSLQVTASGNSDNGIFYGAYGEGANPVISGFTTISAWTNYSGNIYYAALDAANLNIVMADGAIKGMGRYPNTGYLRYTGHTGNTGITDNELQDSPNWTGAEVVIRKNRWIIDRHNITNHSGNTITYDALTTYGNNNAYQPSDGNGYFIQNHVGTLDQSGEWYYDPGAKRIFMSFGSGGPENLIIKASTSENNVVANTKSNITFNGLDFEGGNTKGMSLINCQNFNINTCNFYNQGGISLFGEILQEVTVEGCSISNSLSNGIFFDYEANNCKIEHVSISNTNLIPGAGRSGDGVGIGMLSMGNNITIAHNSIRSSGYHGIQFNGNNILVEKNLIDSFCIVKDDGGGIYTYKGQSDKNTFNERKVADNIILNGIGAAEGSDDTNSVHVHGIYIDDNAENIQLVHNTVAHCGGTGIFIHDAHNLNIITNTLFGNRTGFRMYEDNTNAQALIRDNLIAYNRIFSGNDVQKVFSLGSINGDIDRFGYFDNNYYCHPFGDRFVITATQENPGNSVSYGYDLPDWQSYYKKDLNSKTAPVNFLPYTITGPAGSNMFGNGSFDNGTYGVSNWSPVNNCQTSVTTDSKLDSKALQVSFTSHSATDQLAYITLDIDAIRPSKNYILKFSLLGTKNSRSLQVYLRKKNAPYNDISVRRYCRLSTDRTENELLFSLPPSESDAFLVFEASEYDSTFWIDNVKLYEADILLTDPAGSIRFEYNATDNDKTIYLGDDIYTDVESRLYSGAMILSPWSSAILMKTAGTAQAMSSQRFPGVSGTDSSNQLSLLNSKKNALSVYPNPVRNILSVVCPLELSGRTIQLRITRTSGVEIESRTFKTAGSLISLDVSQFAAGMYFLEISDGSMNYTTTIFKQ